jgi:transcriptional regulator with GAF, ATPase, and Fis domain
MKYMIIKYRHVLYVKDYSQKYIKRLAGHAFRFWTFESETEYREQALTEFIQNGFITKLDAPLMSLEQVEKAHIIKMLNATGHNVLKASKHLGITRRQLGIKIARYGIKQPETIKIS